MQKRRLCLRLCYNKYYVYKILCHTFKVTNIEINSMTETNDKCNVSQHKRRLGLTIIHQTK